ncbi:MAG: DUF885 family protein [Terricaulis sp.]
MIRQFVACAVMALMVGSAAAQSAAQNPVAAAVSAYERISRHYDPITSSGEGDRAALRRLPDVSRETQLAQRADLVALKAQLDHISPTGLSDEDAINRAFLLRVVGAGIESIDIDESRMPISNGDGYFSVLSFMAYATPINSADDAEAYIARLRLMPRFYDQNLANARRGVAAGFTQPQIVVQRALDAAQASLATLTDTALVPFQHLPSTMSAADADRYRAEVRDIVTNQILPKQRETVAFLHDEYLPHARRGIGLSSMPGGRDYYRYLARTYTTTDMTPEQLHALGEREVTRIRAEMNQVIAQSGFRGDFAAFVNFLHSDPQFYAHSGDELTMRYAEVAKRSDAQLPRLFGKLPRLTYGIRVIPAENAEGSTTAYYSQGSPALGQSGTFWINLTHLDQRPLYELPALTLHESVPGHHLQIALAQEQGELPYYRRNANVTAFIEGWGLYAESLGEDMGMYRTPYEQFGRLSYEMWRACRLVADTGIHWMGWDIEHARQCFAQNTALSPHNIQTELERYIATPGQALAYKVGELNFQLLRHDATEALGSHFDIRAFHDELLGAGALPIDLLNTRVHAWIAAQQSATH